MEPLTQVDHQYFTDGAVRIRTPIVPNSLIHAILNAYLPTYWTMKREGLAINPFQLVDELETSIKRKGVSSEEETIEVISELNNYNIYLIDSKLEHLFSAQHVKEASGVIIVLKLPQAHYETVGIPAGNVIQTIFSSYPW